ncbi:hypothetical protein JW935_14475, partial [candidate division KSB1 bacterium]|nr:hypothetical protein [candidate division KSB1 bacterium]
MKRKIYIVLPAILIFACAAPITMMNTERHPINHYTNLEVLEFQNDVIGEINTFIMNKIMEKSIRGIVKLERFEKVSISPKIETNDEYILSNTSSADEAGDNLENTAVLEVILREYKKGNAFVRFLFGALAGSGSVTCDLVVLDKKTSKTMMRAQTTAKIVGAYSSEN